MNSQVVDMWTMRAARAPAPTRGQRAYALPTVRRLRPHDHILAPLGAETKDHIPRAFGADPNPGWVRFTSAIPLQSGSVLIRR